MVNSQLTSETNDAPDESATDSSSLAFTASKQTALGTTLLAAVLATAVLLTIFIGWDMRRLSASVSLAEGHDDPVLETRAQVWADAQAQAPERESFTHALSEQYVLVAKQQRRLATKKKPCA